MTSSGGEHIPGLLMSFPADAIVDAETGCLLRLLCYADGTLAIWSELDDISTEPIDPDEFQVHVPPGTRIVEATGNLITNAVAAIPGVKGTVARTAAEAVNRTARRCLRRPQLLGRLARPSLVSSAPLASGRRPRPADPTGHRLTGQWVGFGRDFDVNVGPWKLELLTTDTTPAAQTTYNQPPQPADSH